MRFSHSGWRIVTSCAPPWTCPPAATIRMSRGAFQVIALVSVEPGAPPPGTVNCGSVLQFSTSPQYGVTGVVAGSSVSVTLYWMYAESVSARWFMSIQVIIQLSCLLVR